MAHLAFAVQMQCMYGGLCLKKKAKNPQKKDNLPLIFWWKGQIFENFCKLPHQKQLFWSAISPRQVFWKPSERENDVEIDQPKKLAQPIMPAENFSAFIPEM